MRVCAEVYIYIYVLTLGLFNDNLPTASNGKICER